MAHPEPDLSTVPPSAKLVLKVLEYHDELTQKEIVERTRLSQRTVRDALERLEDRDVVEKGIYVPDARQNLYRLTLDSGEEVQEDSLWVE